MGVGARSQKIYGNENLDWALKKRLKLIRQMNRGRRGKGSGRIKVVGKLPGVLGK